MNKKAIKTIISIIVAIVVIFGAYKGTNYLSEDDNNNTSVTVSNPDNKLIVTFVDVGQGDCEFIELPNGKCMLIDCGEADYSQSVIDKISSWGYTTLDYVIITHPHIDHMGGMSDIINTFDIGEIYMPKATATTRTYEKLLQTISDKNMKINTAKAGKIVYSDSELEIKFLAPISDEYEELNNYSAVTKITYGTKSFLFTGDAEKLSEEEMVTNSYYELNSDVLKVGHHGSKYSSSISFLNAVSPSYAVIEVGKDNPYDHPHIDAVRRIESIGAKILRTDELGDIKFVCDGQSISIED